MYRAYFKNVNPTIGLDESQNQMLNSLVGSVYTLQEEIAREVTRAQEAEVDKPALTEFVAAFGNSIYLSNAGGTGEFDYSRLVSGFTPSGMTGASGLTGDIPIYTTGATGTVTHTL